MIKNCRGLILVEVLLAAALLGVLLVPILNFFVTGIEGSWFATREIRAQSLAREAWEALRSVRARNWEEINDGSFYPQVSGGVWRLVSSESGETIGPYQRRIVLEPVYRDQAGVIVASGGNLDVATKKVTITVSWQALRDRVLSYTTYLAHYFEDLVWTQTTQAEFDLGEKEYVETTQDFDGEVVLEGGCFENPAGAWIYDENFQNTWQIHPSALGNIREVTQPPGQVYEGENAIEVYDFNGVDTKLRNVDDICTLGFTRMEFYAYNSAEVEQSFFIQGKWDADWVEVVLPPQSWEHVVFPYADVSGGSEINLDFLFFKEGNWQPGTSFFLDNITLGGGIGGYFAQGTLTSSIFDAGRETTFNRVAYTADLPEQTAIGFQVATSNQIDGPWVFYGPGGTTSESDLYTNSEGEGIWLGNNFGNYCRYKAYLFSYDGQNTPVLHEVRINYAP